MAEPCRSQHLQQNNGDALAGGHGRKYARFSIKTLVIYSTGMLLLSVIAYSIIADYKLKHGTKGLQESHQEARATITQQGSSSGSKSFTDVMANKASVHQFNRHMLLPLLKSIVAMDYFRYVKVNLERPCQLWCNADKCNLRDCKVKTLSNPGECPISTYDDSNNHNDGNQIETSKNELATVNTELASDQLDLLIKLFECTDNDDHDLQYVDLLKNPERFTGYSGESAHRIWRAIYEENCFLRKDSRSPFGEDLCYEERIFYEAISGLHSSINIHLCAEYPSNAAFGTFEHNLMEFRRRFDNHPEYLENLYKLFQLELRALANCKPYLLKQVRWPDSSTKSAIEDLLNIVDNFEQPSSLDMMLKPSDISRELAMHFRNITTTIIDCVACDKCKLWGKVQLRGLGTAFKVLSVRDMDKLYLNQQEITSLINAIARLSHSIRQLEEFRQLLHAMDPSDISGKSLNAQAQRNNKNNNLFSRK